MMPKEDLVVVKEVIIDLRKLDASADAARALILGELSARAGGDMREYVRFIPQ